MIEGNVTGSGKYDTSGDVAATPACGSSVPARKTSVKFSASAKPAEALQNNSDTLPAADKRTDTTGDLNGEL
ncbi:MAG: hypothetical protein OK457_00705 [Thaumarchaeota archaeon]|nr:hypothetical protein [Nitrososphaerota archaeon]